MKKPKTQYWSRVYGGIGILTLVMYYLLELDFFSFLNDYLSTLRRFCISITIVCIILILGKFLEKVVYKQTQDEGECYNLIRITRFLVIVFISIIIVSFLFESLISAAVSLGLLSLILGFALQAPITSFIGWLYIVFRKPYKVGDRIQIAGRRGDIKAISYLDTIITECNGDYLGNDRRSGRKIYLPNSILLKEDVVNYSGPQVPFIWNETPVQIAFTSDIDFVRDCLIKATEDDFKNKYPQRAENEGERWKPAVYFRVNKYAWMEAVISYPVEPFDTTGRRNRILEAALPILNENPDKVKFPEGTLR